MLSFSSNGQPEIRLSSALNSNITQSKLRLQGQGQGRTSKKILAMNSWYKLIELNLIMQIIELLKNLTQISHGLPFSYCSILLAKVENDTQNKHCRGCWNNQCYLSPLLLLALVVESSQESSKHNHLYKT
jgi:hypothetical protein